MPRVKPCTICMMWERCTSSERADTCCGLYEADALRYRSSSSCGQASPTAPRPAAETAQSLSRSTLQEARRRGLSHGRVPYGIACCRPEVWSGERQQQTGAPASYANCLNCHYIQPLVKLTGRDIGALKTKVRQQLAAPHLSWLQLAVSTGCSKCSSLRKSATPRRWPCHSSSNTSGCLRRIVLRSDPFGFSIVHQLGLGNSCGDVSGTGFSTLIRMEPAQPKLRYNKVTLSDIIQLGAAPLAEAVQVPPQLPQVVKAADGDAAGLLELLLAEDSVPRPAPCLKLSLVRLGVEISSLQAARQPDVVGPWRAPADEVAVATVLQARKVVQPIEFEDDSQNVIWDGRSGRLCALRGRHSSVQDSRSASHVEASVTARFVSVVVCK